MPGRYASSGLPFPWFVSTAKAWDCISWHACHEGSQQPTISLLQNSTTLLIVNQIPNNNNKIIHPDLCPRQSKLFPPSRLPHFTGSAWRNELRPCQDLTLSHPNGCSILLAGPTKSLIRIWRSHCSSRPILLQSGWVSCVNMCIHLCFDGIQKGRTTGAADTAATSFSIRLKH